MTGQDLLEKLYEMSPLTLKEPIKIGLDMDSNHSWSGQLEVELQNVYNNDGVCQMVVTAYLKDNDDEDIDYVNVANPDTRRGRQVDEDNSVEDDFTSMDCGNGVIRNVAEEDSLDDQLFDENQLLEDHEWTMGRDLPQLSQEQIDHDKLSRFYAEQAYDAAEDRRLCEELDREAEDERWYPEEFDDSTWRDDGGR